MCYNSVVDMGSVDPEGIETPRRQTGTPMSTSEMAEFLAGSDLLPGLGADSFLAVAEGMQCSELAEGDELLMQGDTAEHACERRRSRTLVRGRRSDRWRRSRRLLRSPGHCRPCPSTASCSSTEPCSTTCRSRRCGAATRAVRSSPSMCHRPTARSSTRTTDCPCPASHRRGREGRAAARRRSSRRRSRRRRDARLLRRSTDGR